jgi:hypothetical protein
MRRIVCMLQHIRTYLTCVVSFKNVHRDSVTTLIAPTCSLAYLNFAAVTKKLCLKIQHILQRNVYILTIGSFTPLQLCAEVAKLVVCSIALVRFHNDGSLRTETSRNFQRDIHISK